MTYPNLIIAGFPKSGTSALFRWLTDHPEIVGAKIKETEYLVDPSFFRSRPGSNYATDGLSGYQRFFPSTLPSGVRYVLEATPAYIYQKTALSVVPKLPGRTRVILLLREPSERIYSTYLYFSNNWDHLPEAIDFVEYVHLARTEDAALGPNDLVRCVFDHSRYAKHIAPWIQAIGSDGVLIYLYESLAADPRRFAKAVAADLGIDPAFYDDYSFPEENRTYLVRSQRFQKLNVRLRSLLPQGRIYIALRSLYRRVNTFRPPLRSLDDEAVLEGIREEFCEWNRRLEVDFGVDISPWRHGSGK